MLRARIAFAVAALLPTFYLVGLGTPAHAADPPVVGPNVNVTRAAQNQQEEAVAVDPNNPQRVFIATNDEAVASGLRVGVSTDGGATFARRVIATGNDGLPAACCDPTVSFDTFGNLFIAILDIVDGEQQIVLIVSTDGGATFHQVGQVFDGDADQPTVTTGAGSVWVTWESGGSVHARGARVTGANAIDAFGPVQDVPGSTGGSFGDIAVGPDGQVLVAYQTGGQENDGHLSVSLDADGTGSGGFAAAVQVTTTNVGSFDAIPPQPERSVDAEAGLAWDRTTGDHRGRTYFVYTDEATDESGDTDIWVRTSDDNGAHWSAPVRVNDVTTGTQFLPRIALDQSTGQVGVSFHDTRNDPANRGTQYFAAISTDGGQSFGPNVRVSAGTSNEDGSEPPATGLADLDYGDYSGADFAGGVFHVAWADNSNSTGDNPDGAGHRMDVYTATVQVPAGPPPNQPPTVNAGPDVSGNEGSAIALSGSVSDPDSDPAISWSYRAGPDVDPGATCSFASATSPATTITCTDDGTFTATLTADDGVNAPVSDSAIVRVANVAPTVTITSPAQCCAQPVSQPLALVAPFTDPGTNDTHTCSIVWDDGTTDTFGQEGSCNRTHQYAHAGMYTIVVTVTDDDGGSGTASVLVVIFDPNAGFITDGGWIDSPPGAFTPDPSATGKAHIATEVRYQDATTLTGQVRFRMHEALLPLSTDPTLWPAASKADPPWLDLRSDSLDWLVVTPDGKAAVSGTATLNGVVYRFILYGYDGSPDRMRIVIWLASAGPCPTGPFLYDNRPGASFDLDQADPQELGGGNFQIHQS
jgi:hypothetical protein